jgi:hypothetical protein
VAERSQIPVPNPILLSVLFIHFSLFNDGLSNSDYTSSNYRMTVNDDVETMRKEVVVA